MWIPDEMLRSLGLITRFSCANFTSSSTLVKAGTMTAAESVKLGKVTHDSANKEFTVSLSEGMSNLISVLLLKQNITF